MNAEGLALLRALILKMWALNEARDNGDFAAIAAEVNAWLPREMQITTADVASALRGGAAPGAFNAVVLRDKIDGIPALFSARLSGDYQAILNELRKDAALDALTLADVVGAMAYRPVARPTLKAVGVGRLTGASRFS